MKIDARLDATDIDGIRRTAEQAEAAGYGGLWSSETAHDPFLPLVVAAEHTRTIEIGCAIAVAFARNPMVVANLTHDLQRYSDGRFVLGLGTQVKPHIERRFSMPWSRPAARLAEFIDAVRAIVDAWETGTSLNFEGEFYSHTLMTPMFRPEPHGLGRPRIVMGGVGRAMVETAGQVADGLLVHAFSTPSYLRHQVLPSVEAGLARRSLVRADFEISCRAFLATGRDEEEVASAREAVRQRLGFYGSTPAYRAVLEHHGWGDLAQRLNDLSRTSDPDRWKTMTALIDDVVLETFAVVGEPARAADDLRRRYHGVADRFWFYTPYAPAPGLLDEVTRSLRTP